jgi:flavin-dependent dehydrogenase
MRAVAGDAGRELLALLTDYVEVHTFAGGYCGLSLIQTGEVNVCMLVEKRFLTPLRSTRWHSLLEALSAASPALRSRLEALEPSDDVIHAVGQVPFCDKERSLWPCLFVGDAAGMITPLCGDGQAMAIHSGILLGQLLSDVPSRPSRKQFGEVARRWDRIWRREFQRRIRLGRGVQRLLLHGRSADILLSTLDWLPPLRRYLVRATRGEG